MISGYLGAGKTTLINRLLAQPHGLRLMVMVNDFGAINIDKALIEAQDDDVIALTNGCICCTMGTDLFLALGDALDRRPRPDHLIIEASGIADPAAIANTAIAEPDLIYSGIVTLVDALNINALLSDPLVSPQVAQQMAAADLLVQTKCAQRVADVDNACQNNGLPLPVIVEPSAVSILTLGAKLSNEASVASVHPDYVTWYVSDSPVLDHARLTTALKDRPEWLFRLKGFVRTEQGLQEIHVVGKSIDIKVVQDNTEASLVALGVRGRFTKEAMDVWWQGVTGASSSIAHQQT
ncbi:CobW family GTP-binding protein [Sulfitobacter noctilucicola]|uniref:CobW family GTP-binding protein n=1 Tax=Sulfitobacter noctilucicola TaxID=1342301 RepID=UPI001F4C955F|nr:GTP-binding protein [Sulfitobacter noctilucicola]